MWFKDIKSCHQPRPSINILPLLIFTCLFICGLISHPSHFTQSHSPRNNLIANIPLPLSTPFLDTLLNLKLPSISKHYVVVFDAGSTGTRMHVFKFLLYKRRNNVKVKLLSENFNQVKPGLSSYGDNPRQAAESLRPLLDFGLTKIPIKYRYRTPILMKATAGLRLLPGDKADQIIQEVDSYLRSIDPPFLMDNNSVSIMGGEDEGIYGWTTINFLLGTLQSSNDSVVALDLGGGSTQITFAPLTNKVLQRAPKDYIVQRSVLKKRNQLYTHSYLGNGLMSARKGILRLSKHRPINETTVEVNHPCFPDNYNTSWTFEGIIYLVKGVRGDCHAISRQYVLNQGISPVPELNDKPIYAVSYFYDRAFETNLIRDNGPIRVNDFYLKAQTVCDESVDPSNPFICLDLHFITSFLTYGYGLNMNKSIILVKGLNGRQTSWPLGAALNLL